MTDTFQTVSPIDGAVVAERPFATEADGREALERARGAFPRWRARSLAERAAMVAAFVDAVVAKKDALADELTLQMGRPRRSTPFRLCVAPFKARRTVVRSGGCSLRL